MTPRVRDLTAGCGKNCNICLFGPLVFCEFFVFFLGGGFSQIFQYYIQSYVNINSILKIFNVFRTVFTHDAEIYNYLILKNLILSKYHP